MTVTDPERILRPTPEEAFEAYAALVAANREQVERLREYIPGTASDFWAGRAATFRPGVLEAPELDGLYALARPDDTWLDIGAGGGRFAVPLSRRVARVIAAEPSPAMRGVLADAAVAGDRTNIDVVDLRWPPSAVQPALLADVSLAANVVYDIDDIGAFIDAMEAHTRRTCAVIVSDRAPRAADVSLWQALYGEPFCGLPSLREFVAILGALGRAYEVRSFALAQHEPVEIDQAMPDLCHRFWVTPGSERADRLRALVIEHLMEPSGLVRLSARRSHSAVVSWTPPAR